ncbi:PREDICTED: trihelix transcription factor GTL1-like [Wasmannia auropunctata]|uniref:trihelix transcription factor GTL1-like n=1 Tax=Wasmannia auropunctata TaxID=64793 RepID=UPI0005F0B956|nr:PREDICTED: trihelix transcription factor GTL1-like [Wasmannia auropunctata]
MDILQTRNFFKEDIPEFCQQKDSEIEDNVTTIVTKNLSCDKYGEHATWEHAAIMLLFSLRKENDDLFKSDKIRNDVAWKKIAESFREKGYMYTTKQIENKWKNLRKNYMKVKDNNSKSGAPLKTCKYFDEMEEVYGTSPSVQPVAVASNLSEKDVFLSTDEEEKLDEDITVPLKKSKIEKQMEMWTKYFDEKIAKSSRPPK